MAIEHVLTDIDTVHNLAVRYGVSWRDIVEYNGLEYPYIVSEIEAYRHLHASGFLKITRALYTTPVTIYAGSTFMTEIDDQGIQKVYELVEDVTLEAGQASGYGFVRCTLPGTFGNTIQNTIIIPGNVLSSLGEYLSELTITNERPFTNGSDAKVRITGQTILIPTSEDLAGAVQRRVSPDNYLNQLGGEDLKITEDGDLTDDGLGDLGSVIGVDNIAQAIRHRLMTRKGSLPKQPDYGSDLHSIIGKANLPYINNLVEIYIHDALGQDDRFSGFEVTGVETRGTTVRATVMVKLAHSNEAAVVDLDMDFSQAV